MRFRLLLLSALFSLTAALGCGDGAEAPSEEDRPVIGVSVLTATNPFFNELSGAIVEAAEEHGYDATVVSSEFDVSRQRNQVSDFIVQGVDAIVLTPANSRSITTAIAEANAAGIPVFTADIAVMDSTVSIVSHIATDNRQAGRMAAEALLEALGGQGKIGILDYPEVESVILRTQGFLERLEEHRRETGTTLEVVSRLPSGGMKDVGYRAAQDMLQAHADLAGIFAINDPSALGAVAALEEAGRADDVVVVSVDGQPEGRQAIKEGRIYADAIQHPDRIGRQTVEAILRYMAGEPVEPEILIPTDLYYRSDALADSTLS